MIEWVIGNLRPTAEHRFIFLCLLDHLERYPLKGSLEQWAPDCEVIPVRSVTDGAACTVLLARDVIGSDDPLMIANSDQWIDIAIDEYLGFMGVANGMVPDGLIMTMTSTDPKWSFVRLDGDHVVEVVEKVPVSSEATVGVYNFRRGSSFLRAADAMIAEGVRVNGEFYVAPTYNWLLREGGRVRYHNVGSDGHGMHGLGTPEDLTAFMASGRVSDLSSTG
jgi:dTDP-glucose pyrophosphorylase